MEAQLLPIGFLLKSMRSLFCVGYLHIWIWGAPIH